MQLDTQNGSYALPKLTFALSDKMDKAAAAGSDKNGYKARYDFVVECLGSEAAAVELDGSKFDDIDLVALAVTFQNIAAAYSQPIIEAQRAQLEAQTSGWADTLDPVTKALAAAKEAKAMGNRQQFNRVK